MGVQTYLAYALPLLYANLNAFIRKESMADRFKDDKTKQDYTFYSMGKTSKKEKENAVKPVFHNFNLKKETVEKLLNSYMYCIKCGSNPIIKVDNAKEYICDKCIKKMLSEKWNIKDKK